MGAQESEKTEERIDRDLDGIYFRVQRDGKWESVCFSDLTEEQMYKVLEGRSTEWLMRMCMLLGKSLRDIGDQFNIAREQGDHFRWTR